jgi:folylpolyglutamate synthase/dihydropteroate synthase
VRPLVNGGELPDTLASAIKDSKEVMLVCGSFYIMDEVRKFYFKDEQIERDPESVNN